MLSIIIIFFSIFSILQPPPAVTAEKRIEHIYGFYCCQELRPSLSTLQQLPEVNELIHNILKTGPLSIEINHHLSQQFEGYWSAEDRTIYITNSYSEASLINTILFEMHNAVNDEGLKHLDTLAYNGKLSRSKYIEGVEYWEYQNARATAAILNKGIEMGLFPRECYWPLSNNFKEHFRIQKAAGHSAHIGKMYDSIKF